MLYYSMCIGGLCDGLTNYLIALNPCTQVELLIEGDKFCAVTIVVDVLTVRIHGGMDGHCTIVYH